MKKVWEGTYGVVYKCQSKKNRRIYGTWFKKFLDEMNETLTPQLVKIYIYQLLWPKILSFKRIF